MNGIGRMVSLLVLAGCASGGPPERAAMMAARLPAFPDSATFGVHVLTLQRAPDNALWAGTFGKGIFVLPQGAEEWRQIRAADSTSIAWDFVNSIAFASDGSVWYGTVGNGFGRSTDNGDTWRNWQFAQLGPEWQYVAPDGIRTRGDTVYVATADGLRITSDGGNTWLCIEGAARVSGGAAPRDDACTESVASLPSEYLLSVDVDADGVVWVGDLFGAHRSADGGRTWTSADSLPRQPVRAIAANTGRVWLATERALYRLETNENEARVAAEIPWGARAIVVGDEAPTLLGGLGAWSDAREVSGFSSYRPANDFWTGLRDGQRLIAGTSSGIRPGPALRGDRPAPTGRAAAAEAGRHLWFQRPVRLEEGNPYVDATYRYGSTMGGNFQQHQGVEFNNPAGTVVRAIGDGEVVFAGSAEAGANTIAIRHAQRWEDKYVFSVYYHNSSVSARLGQTVRAGEEIARVGNTGRATNDHLHLEVHVAPSDDVNVIVDPDERFPPYTVNPQLWIAPIAGTGVVAGRVFDSAGNPVPGARIYGLVMPYPEETPYSFAETYEDHAHPDPAYGEHFAVGDVPPGRFLLGVEVEGEVIWKYADVRAGAVTFLEFRP